MLQILRFRALRKANLWGTLCGHCPGLCPLLLSTMFFWNWQVQPSRSFLNVSWVFASDKHWEPARPLHVSRALQAGNAEGVSKMSPGASGPGAQKSLQKVSGTVWDVCLESVLDCPRNLARPEAPGDIFETFSAFRARRARETPLRGDKHGKCKFQAAHEGVMWQHVCKDFSGPVPLQKCVILEDFAVDFSGGCFWALFPIKWGEKSGDKVYKKSGGPKTKILGRKKLSLSIGCPSGTGF